MVMSLQIILHQFKLVRICYWLLKRLYRKRCTLRTKENLTSKIYGLELIDRGIARQGYEVYKDDKVIGFVTSGFMIPGTKNSYANALLEGKYKMGDQVEIEIRNRKIKAVIRKKNYKEKSYKGRWKNEILH